MGDEGDDWGLLATLGIGLLGAWLLTLLLGEIFRSGGH